MDAEEAPVKSVKSSSCWHWPISDKAWSKVIFTEDFTVGGPDACASKHCCDMFRGCSLWEGFSYNARVVRNHCTDTRLALHPAVKIFFYSAFEKEWKTFMSSDSTHTTQCFLWGKKKKKPQCRHRDVGSKVITKGGTWIWYCVVYKMARVTRLPLSLDVMAPIFCTHWGATIFSGACTPHIFSLKMIYLSYALPKLLKKRLHFVC